MKNETLFAIIDDIDDEYIMEFAKVEKISNVRRKIIRNICLLVACIVVIIGVLSIVELNKEQKNEIITMDKEDGTNVIWGRPSSDVEQFQSNHTFNTEEYLGQIILDEELKEAMRVTISDKDLFAVWVYECTGKSHEKVYGDFIMVIGVEEDYLNKKLIFATKTQLESMTCPDDMIIILGLACR
ncbi:MAG: hypothetical protein IKL73_02260 [Lachnospiraceae bacterium]|nr:hypothetical protein [Lachnospiraceae bacterium]